ncbi:MAG: HAD-IB family phosphatase [Candidatus Methylomirabilis oxygeniifera]|uniref:Putative 2, 3-diketo-5-methylthio-1-phosphopentane phosphatase (Phosphoserine phosphatase) (SerB) n=1 Tax=Methylomirabilis oxygeniifera TaxID=671143 RepID=D5MJW1_METO1|nr:MAG: HAD-IB family phosphatase [Candidatus Methylomirabilis oxyfera]CBE67544.1 putative 2, 3-diketo-5-methylthio-1-phosphopentane phosphatase (phosphoserine phosphatase) (serB) [Candidatus Methylomirabilis oxyfera]
MDQTLLSINYPELEKPAAGSRSLRMPSDLPAFQVLCDFDGTITRTDVTDAILEAFALPAFREWQCRWERGEITSRECLSRQVELIQADQSTLMQFAATLPIDKGIVTLQQRCAQHGIPLIIVSDGIDRLIEAVLRRYGLSSIPVVSNRLVCDGNGSFSLGSPYASPDCRIGAGTCKCAVASFCGLSLKETIYIGDGRSDRCISTVAQKVYAKAGLREWCDLQGISCEPFETLTEVTEHLFRKVSCFA